MMYLLTCILTALAMAATAAEQLTPAQARALYADMSVVHDHTPFKPTAHPDAQWFGNAGFGLFIHWGIHSTAAVNPSWEIYDNRFGGIKSNHTYDEYYALADNFDPQKYDPDSWMQMASSLGMKYAVVTAKHHDGYCLWPTEYGTHNTRTKMHGRDLIAEYVAACRQNGIKVGFYFSPR
ncbi:MAG: alpha-L-fucosidase, partial [Planctomycetota bacterium]